MAEEHTPYYRALGAASASLSLCLHIQSILYDQGRTLLAYLLRNMSLSKQARNRTFQEWWEEKYFCCAQDDNVRCFLRSIVQKGTHKRNIKRDYDTVLCSKSAADAANLSIFTLPHVHCVVRRHLEATLSRPTWLLMPGVKQYQLMNLLILIYG